MEPKSGVDDKQTSQAARRARGAREVEGAKDQCARGRAVDKYRDAITTVVEWQSNRGGRAITSGVPNPWMTRDESAQRCCQYRVGKVVDQLETLHHVGGDQQRRPLRQSRRENDVEGEMPEQHAVAGEERSAVEEEPT
uniref:Uncharacterized protein n=1 Tax=Leersia perrieri TaxID=77586 RepID=A0A0D9XVT6_9ORYZ